MQSHLTSKNWIDSSKTELSPPRAKHYLTRSQDLQVRNVQNQLNIVHPSLQKFCMTVYCCCSEILLEHWAFCFFITDVNTQWQIQGQFLTQMQRRKKEKEKISTWSFLLLILNLYLGLLSLAYRRNWCQDSTHSRDIQHTERHL